MSSIDDRVIPADAGALVVRVEEEPDGTHTLSIEAVMPEGTPGPAAAPDTPTPPAARYVLRAIRALMEALDSERA